MDFPWNNHPASGIHHLWKSPYNPVCLGAFGCKLKLYPKCLTVPSSHCDCLCCQLCIFLWGGDGIVIQRTQWGVIIPTSYVKFVCIFRKNSVWISELPFFGSHLYITLRAGFSLFFLFSQASLSFITVLGVYILIKLATSPFYHVWIPCVYPSKGPRLFKVITYFFRKRVNANHNNSWWIKFRVFPNTSKQSQKLKVHEEDINNFGKVPSITTRLYNNDVWRIWEYQYRLERKLTVCAETNDGTFKGGLHNF